MKTTIQRFLIWIGYKSPVNITPAERYGIDNLDDDVIGYPPDQKGIPVVKHSVIIKRLYSDTKILRNSLGLSPEDFDLYVYPVIVSFIKFAHLLPASEYHHHSTGGGLIYHSLDVAKRAMKQSQMTEYPVSIGNLGDTQQSNIQWKTATVLAGLLHDCGKVVTDMSITNGEKGKRKLIWDAYGEKDIVEWAFEHGIERYFISWAENRNHAHLNASVAVLQKMIPTQTMTWLDSCFDGKTIHSAMLAAVSSASSSHIIAKVVAEADSKSLRQDMFNRNSHMTREMKRTPISIILSDIIKDCIITGRWEINKKNAKVWFVDNELYFMWVKIVPELIAELKKAGYEIPESPDVLARIMYEEGVASRFSEDEIYFNIYPEILGEKNKPQRLMCLKYLSIDKVIKNPDKLYSITNHKPKETAKQKAINPTKQEHIQEDDSAMISEADDAIQTIEDIEDEQPEYIEVARLTVQRLIKSAAESNTDNQKEQSKVNIEQPGTNEEKIKEIPEKMEVFNSESELVVFIQQEYNFEINDGMLLLPESQ